MFKYCYIEDNIIKFCDHSDYEYEYGLYSENDYVEIYYECNKCEYRWTIGASFDELDLERENYMKTI